jgi:transposase
MFDISLATLKRYMKQRGEEGHVRPKAIPGRPPKKRAQVEAGVLPQLQTHPDATLEQHCTMWEQTHGERVSRWTMSRAIERLGWTRKKSRSGQRSAMRKSVLRGEKKPAASQRMLWSLLMKLAPILLWRPCMLVHQRGSEREERCRAIVGRIPR